MEKIILAFCIVNFFILCFIQANMLRKQNDMQDQNESKDADEREDCEHNEIENLYLPFSWKDLIRCTKCKEILFSK